MNCKNCEDILSVANRRIKALQQLLVFYRIGGQPTEKLFKELEVTEKKWDKLNQRKEGRVDEQPS